MIDCQPRRSSMGKRQSIKLPAHSLSHCSCHRLLYLVSGLARNKVERIEKAEKKKEAKFLAVPEAGKVSFHSIPGSKEKASDSSGFSQRGPQFLHPRCPNGGELGRTTLLLTATLPAVIRYSNITAPHCSLFHLSSHTHYAECH